MPCPKPSSSPGILCSWQTLPAHVCRAGPSPRGASMASGGAAWGPRGGEVLREGVLPWNRSGGCSRKKHNGRKPRFRFQMEKTLQDTWGEQPDIINVKFSWEHKEQPEEAPSWKRVLLAQRSLGLDAVVAQATTCQDSHAQRTKAIPNHAQHRAQLWLLPACSLAIQLDGKRDAPWWAGTVLR